ncbi:deazaflavin-dependent oxidoreductase, nitroreductase family [Microbacterium sp. cf046]|uniref:nitroreductase family deazaflavin-dependent oxidoreductase n=1 Tax=Microbacterium sp. cf046 TaxID=1761803 RepID=UPI0008E6B752|nr:nitroreductase family deazaflavin-dependent oxidoreductase [Microbacterium sp. cf046]SFS15130.1 deazaflavin-dependent oxidoreductase, nitroreductase family [Microbacterium sp. cf046]
MGRFKKAYLDLLNRTLNPLTLRAAKRGRGPFSLVRHVGRKSGRTFETPLILAGDPLGGGFLVAELTYGDQVNWYRNVVAGGGQIVHRGRTYRIVSVETIPAEEGLRAFGGPRSAILRLLRRHDFRRLDVELVPDAAP